jgi:autophagy-related protein 9
LEIPDHDIVTLKWENIISKFNKLYGNNDINVFYINNKITIKDNYLITIFDKEIIRCDYLTQLMEWNIMYCFINPMFDSDFRYKNEFLYMNTEYIKKVKDKTKTVAIVNFIFMPILLPFLILQNIFKYGEKFYSKPELLSSRHWTLSAKWKFRNYNELYHEFHDKLLNSTKVANDYANQFPIRLLGTFAEMIVFILSSFFVILVVATIVNDGVLLHLYISNNKNVIWYLGIFATVIAILRTFIRERIIYYPDAKLKELTTIINVIDNENIKNKKHEDYFFNLYQYHIITLFKDIYYTVMTPFHLYELTFNINIILPYLAEITVNNAHIGHTNRFALFEQSDIKSYLSKETFHINNVDY